MRLISSIAVAALLAGLSSPVFAVGSLKIVPGTDTVQFGGEPQLRSRTGDISEAPDTSGGAEPDQAAGWCARTQSVLGELSVLGLPGELGKTDDGHPSIALRIAGLNTYIDFYDCDDDLTDCYTLLFNVSARSQGDATLDRPTTGTQADHRPRVARRQ